MPLDQNNNSDRCYVMTPESAILDLIKCLEQNPNSKKEKRLNRLGFLMMYFGDAVSASTIARLGGVLNKLQITSADSEHFVQNLEALKEEIARHESDDGSIVFPKAALGAKFVVPLKQAFNDGCKDIVNHDGYVYDVFTAIVVISYEQLLWTADMLSILRYRILAASKLIFKGGAALGKHLFMNDKRLWASMPEHDRQFVLNNFVYRGDNDTGLCFNKEALLKLPYDVDFMNSEIGSILTDLQIIVARNVKKFKVEEILASYLARPNGQVIRFADEDFVVQQRVTNSFMIVDRNEEEKEIVFIGAMPDDPKYLFGSTSYLEFPSPDGELVKFHLARIKASYTAQLVKDGETISVNCYAECLDISVPLLDSAEMMKTEYQPVKLYEE